MSALTFDPTQGTTSPFSGVSGKPCASNAQIGSAAGASSNPASADSVKSLGATFMSLLAQELQNQDPTQPMSSTEMVGQMISLNQLDQVASINQFLTTQFGGQAASPNLRGVVTPTSR